jgi:hypothetical protein
MAAAIAILVIIALVAGVALTLFLRSLVSEESSTKAQLRDPDTHTVTYAIPTGVDPVVLEVALTNAGFTSMVERVGDAECLRVVCDESERARVRHVIEDVHASEYAGADLSLGRVVFEDER